MENNESIKRIELAEKELKAAKEALQETPKYVELNGDHWGEDSWVYNKKGLIVKVLGISPQQHLSGCTDLHIINPEYPNKDYYIDSHYFVPSTKEAFDKQNEIIRVPDCIKFEHIDDMYGFGIVFNNSKQVLYYDRELYKVTHTVDIQDGSNFKLTKCERSDLKAGDVAYYQNNELLSIKHLDFYAVILNNKEHVALENETSCVISDEEWDDWYKVEKI